MDVVPSNLRNDDGDALPVAREAPELGPAMMSGRWLMATGRHVTRRCPAPRAAAAINARLRVLSSGDQPALRAHFAALNADDLRMRFCHVVTPEVFESYVAQIGCDGTVSFGVFSAAGALLGTAQLAMDRDLAEVGLSVLEQYRCSGIGTALVECAADYARSRRARVISLHCLADNVPIIRLARRVGMAVTFDGGEADAFLFLAAPAYDEVLRDWSAAACLATSP